MKLRNLIALCAVLILASCTEENNPVQQYGNTVTGTYKKAKQLDNKVNVQQVQKSIQEFYAANNRYPATLQELSAFNGISLKSDNYDYNPVTGSITEKQ